MYRLESHKSLYQYAMHQHAGRKTKNSSKRPRKTEDYRSKQASYKSGLSLEGSECIQIFAARYTRWAQKCIGYSPSFLFQPRFKENQSERIESQKCGARETITCLNHSIMKNFVVLTSSSAQHNLVSEGTNTSRIFPDKI